MKLDDAIEEDLDYCIQNNLLAEYFAENRGRVAKLMLTEYASKIHLKKIKYVIISGQNGAYRGFWENGLLPKCYD